MMATYLTTRYPVRARTRQSRQFTFTASGRHVPAASSRSGT